MSKRSFLQHITPLPPSISRQTALAQLHDHSSMISLNPLVLRHTPCDPPPAASPDEAAHATWYEITDKIAYLPFDLYTSELSYKACFYDLPNGLQTHVFAPAGVDIRAKWSVGGNMPGERREDRELGEEKEGIPREGLYCREEVDLRCNVVMSGFIRRNMKKSHGEMAEKLVERARRMQEEGGFPTANEAVGAGGGGVGQLRGGSGEENGEVGAGGENGVARAQSSLGLGLGQVNSATTHYSYVPHCACEGTAHGRGCPLFTPSDINRQSYFDPPLRSGIQNRSARATSGVSALSHSLEDANPHELHGSPGANSCHCTGGLHSEGCSYYPGLRLPTHTPLSAPTTPSASDVMQSLPQPQPRHTASSNTSFDDQWFTHASVDYAEMSGTRASGESGGRVRDFSRPFRNR